MKQTLLLVGYFCSGILIGGSLVYSTMRHTPVTDAVYKTGEAIVTFHEKHHTFPGDLTQLPGISPIDLGKYGITFDSNTLTLSTSLGGDYYETSFLYALTKGLVGRRFTYHTPGWEISEQLE